MEEAKTKAEQPKTEKPKTEPAKVQPKASGQKMAVLLIRNTTHASGEVRDTLKMLKLYKKLTCSVFDANDALRGMLAKVKDYVTYGELDDATLKMLEEKRGKKDKEGKTRKDFHLHPPRGGFERKGIKHSYTQGGAVGYRGSKIDELINKML